MKVLDLSAVQFHALRRRPYATAAALRPGRAAPPSRPNPLRRLARRLGRWLSGF
jgi:hypothetical protein